MGAAALLAVTLALLVLLPAAGRAGPVHVDDTLQRYFQLEWAATPGTGGPQIAGYVENLGNVPFERMRLIVERLDPTGAVVGTSTTYVMGVVTPRHRTYFTTRVPTATTYRVRILSFDWSNCRD
jgi:hypothetical protein